MNHPNPLLQSVLCLTLIFAFNVAFSQTDFWEQSNGPEGGWVSDIVIAAEGNLFAAGNGVFKSTDDAATWRQVGLEYYDVSALVVNSSGHLFAGTQGSGVFRSTDGGETWISASTGLSQRWVLSLAINSTGDIFAGTIDGVFRSNDLLCGIISFQPLSASTGLHNSTCVPFVWITFQAPSDFTKT